MKKKLSLFHVCLCISMMFSLQVLAQTNYYVATSAQNGNDANAGTSIEFPFATVTAAIAKVVAGDTIFVRSGTYVSSATIRISKAGTAANHIVLRVYKPDLADANARPVFNFS